MTSNDLLLITVVSILFMFGLYFQFKFNKQDKKQKNI